jgi:hypothetical protein
MFIYNYLTKLCLTSAKHLLPSETLGNKTFKTSPNPSLKVNLIFYSGMTEKPSKVNISAELAGIKSAPVKSKKTKDVD